MVTMKPVLTIDNLIEAAKRFCEIESGKNHVDLIGITDGKAVGTYVEHRFERYLQSNYSVEIGNSAKGIDLPGADIQTDIKFLGWAIICWSLFMRSEIKAIPVCCISRIVPLLTKTEQPTLLLQNACVKW